MPTPAAALRASIPCLACLWVVSHVQPLAAVATWIEAEWVQPAEEWVVDTTFAGYHGSGYLAYTGGRSRSTSISMAYRFMVPESGTYRIELRCRRDKCQYECPCDAASDHCNDVFTRLDDGSWHKTMIKRAQYGDDDGGGGSWSNWYWDGRLAERSPSQPVYELSAGEHVWYLSSRSPGVSIDAIAIFPDGGTRPDSSAPSWLIRDGEAPEITAGPTADPAVVSGTQSQLQVLATDPDGDDAQITYRWSLLEGPEAADPPVFEPNDDAAASTTTVTLQRAGAYRFQVTATDEMGLSVSAPLTLTAEQSISGVTVRP